MSIWFDNVCVMIRRIICSCREITSECILNCWSALLKNNLYIKGVLIKGNIHYLSKGFFLIDFDVIDNFFRTGQLYTKMLVILKKDISNVRLANRHACLQLQGRVTLDGNFLVADDVAEPRLIGFPWLM